MKMWLVLLVLLPILGLLLLGLVISTVIAVVVGIVAYALPVLLILAGLWLIARAIGGPGDRRHHRRDARGRRHGPYRPTPTNATSRPAQQRPAASPPSGPPRRELPIDVQVKAEQIRHKAGMLAAYADRFPPFSRDLYIVRQTAADYLPRTLAAYLAVPGTDDPIVRATGRTALEELRAQLAMLDTSLDAITQNLQQRDLDGLVANRRFLEDRFAPDDADLDGIPHVGAPRTPAGPVSSPGPSSPTIRSA